MSEMSYVTFLVEGDIWSYSTWHQVLIFGGKVPRSYFWWYVKGSCEWQSWQAKALYKINMVVYNRLNSADFWNMWL